MLFNHYIAFITLAHSFSEFIEKPEGKKRDKRQTNNERFQNDEILLPLKFSVHQVHLHLRYTLAPQKTQQHVIVPQDYIFHQA